MSFKSRDKITVFSKPAAETSDDVWYVEINGKYGYAPKKFIQEEKVIVSSSKLILVQNVPTVTPPVTPTTEKVHQNINESSPDNQSAEIKNSSEATVSDVNEVKNEERLKRSVDEPNSASKTVDSSENVGATNVDEVKIEDLNKYDSKNFDESTEGNDEDEDEDDEEDDEYDDAENSLDSELSEEEEIRKPVVEEPFVKKTAYVTTDSKVENSSDIGNDGVQPTLEIMAPTQSEIEQLKQQQQLKDSIQDTNDPTLSTVNSSVDLENSTSPTTSTLEPIASESQFTTTTVPIDEPQNPLDIGIETTTPLPDAAKNKEDGDASNIEAKKERELHTNLVSGSGNEATPKGDSATKETTTSEEPLNPTTNELLDEQIPPFKPLPPSPDPVDNIGSDLNDSTTEIPNVNASVDQPVGVDKPVDDVPSVAQEPEKPIAPSNDNYATANDETATNLQGENQITRQDETVTVQPAEVVDNKLEVSNESLPMEVETTNDNSAEPPIPETKLVVESVDSVDINYETNNATSTSSDDTVHAENESVSPIEILGSEKTEDVISTVDYLTQNVNEGVGVIEPIIQSTNIEGQHQAGSNLESEQTENVESKEGIFDMVINSVKNLFGGSSTVESIVEEEQSNENFDKALNDILFSQATSDEGANEGMCQKTF